jgi:hypothetical protein
MSIAARRCLRLFIFFLIIFFYSEVFFNFTNNKILQFSSFFAVFLITDTVLRKIFREPDTKIAEYKNKGIMELWPLFAIGISLSFLFLWPHFFLQDITYYGFYSGLLIGVLLSLFLLLLWIIMARKGESLVMLFGGTRMSRLSFLFLAFIIGLYYLGILSVTSVVLFTDSALLSYAVEMFFWSSLFFFSISFIQLILLEKFYHKRFFIGIKNKIT